MFRGRSTSLLIGACSKYEIVVPHTNIPQIWDHNLETVQYHHKHHG